MGVGDWNTPGHSGRSAQFLVADWPTVHGGVLDTEGHVMSADAVRVSDQRSVRGHAGGTRTGYPAWPVLAWDLSRAHQLDLSQWQRGRSSGECDMTRGHRGHLDP